jgi:S-DNA-T family DNA segregation ATPase FtsK/SpoIIIE
MVALMAAVDFSPVKAAKILAGAALWVRDRAGDFVVRRREMKRRRLQVARDRELIEKTRTRREIKIVVEQKQKPPPKHQPRQVKMPFISEGEFTLPPTDLLDEVSVSNKKIDSDALLMNAKILENKLRDFGVQGEVVEVQPGPVITMYEYKPGPGVKINKIANLADDLAMALSAMSVRIIAPIPGKDVVGIEISNRDRETVYMREIAESEEFSRVKGAMPMALGKNITGDPFAFDLRKAPHLLVAGATGSGKSVCLNSMIMSVLYRSTPREVQMLMIDPKKLELSVYEGIPHLIHRVIADPKDAALSLKWAVAEMDRRYSLLAEQGVRNVDSYNRLALKSVKERKKAAKKNRVKTGDGDTVALADRIDSQDPDKKDKTDPPEEPMPLILVIIDELADLMMVAARDIEESICRLAQMARAAGMHLVVATQRPSVDVITGLIKANFPARIGFKVASKTDSRTILDQNGAERMLGQGDMLFIQPGTSDMIRLHGAFVSDQEIKKVTEYWKEQGEPDYDEEIIKPRADDKSLEPEDADEKWDEALRVVAATGTASVSMLQRKLKIGYNRAARIIERMAAEGIVGPSDGVKPREVLIDPYQLEQ